MENKRKKERSCVCSSDLSVSEVPEDGGEFLGAAVESLDRDGRVRVPPVHREPVDPHVVVLQMSSSDAGVKTVNLTAGAG